MTSFVNLLAGTSVWSPELLKVQWKVTMAGLASTWHRSVTVSCFRAPYSSSRSCTHTGASEKQNRTKVSLRLLNTEVPVFLVYFRSLLYCNTKELSKISQGPELSTKFTKTTQEKEIGNPCGHIFSEFHIYLKNYLPFLDIILMIMTLSTTYRIIFHFTTYNRKKKIRKHSSFRTSKVL